MIARIARITAALALVVSVAAALVPASAVLAETIHVPGQYGTIQEAIDNANLAGGDTIVVAAGTYSTATNGELFPIDIDRPLTIQGAGEGSTIVDGGGGAGVFTMGVQTVVMSGMTIQNGWAAMGAGVFNVFGDLTMVNCTVAGNGGATWGAGIGNYGRLEMINCTVGPNNTVDTGGGGIYNEDGDVILTECTISGNTAGEGGGIQNVRGTLTMTDCTVSGNTAGWGGAGIDNFEGTATLTGCTVSGNSITRTDGGIAYGGGIYNERTLTLTNCTVSGNSVTSTGAGTAWGGGIDSDGTVTLTNCTVTGNSVAGGGGQYGGGVDNLGGSLTLICTIVYGNTAATGPRDIYNTLTFTYMKQESIVGDPDGDSDPLLGPLQGNGGPTETHALRHGSPAIDACRDNCTVVTDQRGEPRPAGTRCDIGAYEGSLLPPPNVPGLSLWGSTALAVLLAVALAWSARRRLATKVSVG